MSSVINSTAGFDSQALAPSSYCCDNPLPASFFSHVIDSVNYSEEHKESYKEKLEIALDYLLFGNYPSLTDFKRVFKALRIAMRRDPELLAYGREAMQQMFFRLHQVLVKVEKNSAQEEMMEIFLKDCLSVYAFLEPYNDENPTLTIPVRVDGEWNPVEYTLVPIRLTPDWVPDPLYAYGLQAEGYDSHLLFMGTPPGAVTGTATAKFVDTIPFGTVGEQLYRWGKDEILNWVDALGNEPLHIYGKSLGGAMALMTGDDLSPKVDCIKVNAFNAPGFVGWKSKGGNRSKVCFNVYSTENDAISNFLGVFPEDANCYKIKGERKKFFVHAHNTGTMGFRNLSVAKYAGSQVNKSLARRVLNIVFQILCVTLLFPFYSIRFGIRLVEFHVLQPAWAEVKTQTEKIARYLGLSKAPSLEALN